MAGSNPATTGTVTFTLKSGSTVIGAATTDHRVLFQHTQARCSLTGIDQLGLGAGDGCDKSRRLGGNAGHVLHDVKSRSLGGEQAARGTGYNHKAGALDDLVSVLGGQGHFNPRIVVAKYGGADFETGHGLRLAGVHLELGPCVGVDHGLDREVAGANILGEPQIDQAAGHITIKHRLRLPRPGCPTTGLSGNCLYANSIPTPDVVNHRIRPAKRQAFDATIVGKHND